MGGLRGAGETASSAMSSRDTVLARRLSVAASFLPRSCRRLKQRASTVRTEHGHGCSMPRDEARGMQPWAPKVTQLLRKDLDSTAAKKIRMGPAEAQEVPDVAAKLTGPSSLDQSSLCSVVYLDAAMRDGIACTLRRSRTWPQTWASRRASEHTSGPSS